MHLPVQKVTLSHEEPSTEGWALTLHEADKSTVQEEEVAENYVQENLAAPRAGYSHPAVQVRDVQRPG